MKKTLLFAFAMLFATAMMAQNRAVLLQESFDDTSMPAGWSVAGLGLGNWSVSPTNNAGGAANEMHLTWSPQFNGLSRLVTPAVDLTGINSLVFSFKHALDNYTGNNIIGIATTSDGGTTWNEAWSQGYSASNSWTVSQEISTPDMGQANVQFCIFFNGNSYNINDWYFDDIMVFTLENLDLAITSPTLPDFIGSGETAFGINVFNFGATTVTSVEATYEVEGMEPITETFDVEIPSLGNETLIFPTTTLLSPGTYNVAYSINLVNGQEDDVLDNNTAEKAVFAAIGTAEKIPMIEHFSSSTCGPCVSVNTTMLNFCNNNAGRFTYTKYQMNWPGSGDPYYTEEGGVRRTYYGVNAVPQCFLDGEDQGYAAVQQTVFDQHAERTAFVDIRGSFVVEGNTINIKADIIPFIDADARVFVSVNEKETHNNVGGNGETSFHHVFMKMLPDAQGTTVNLVTCEPQHFEFTQDMSGTHVEEMSDLEVSIWVQNYDSKEMFNSRFAYEYTEEHPYAVENLTLIQDEEAEENTMVASWDAPTMGNPTGYNVYVNNELVAENISDLSYTFAGELGAFYTVAVVALYGDDKTSIKMLAGMENTWSVEEVAASVCKVYPNPANSQVRIEAENDIESVMVYNMLGALVETVNADSKTVNVNLNQYSNGVYFFNIRQSNGVVTNQRVVVSH
ncbi:MAG: T9SS type A sorting domain-containing protein [Bacteroidales bacterium]|nr:T9SS type A sorting domain-containing protein [Bacteroidales bacterium]